MLRLNGHIILFDGPLTTTKLACGTVEAFPQEDEAYRARALALGYGSDTAAMSRDHEVGHALLAKWFGLEVSPTLEGVARSAHWPEWQKEEAAVLAIQAFARALDVNLVDLAYRYQNGELR